MLNINKVVVAGHVGSVEIRYTSRGDAVLNLSIATNRRWTDKDTQSFTNSASFPNTTTLCHSTASLLLPSLSVQRLLVAIDKTLFYKLLTRKSKK
jgi:hypothetical protein